MTLDISTHTRTHAGKHAHYRHHHAGVFYFQHARIFLFKNGYTCSLIVRVRAFSLLTRRVRAVLFFSAIRHIIIEIHMAVRARDISIRAVNLRGGGFLMY